MKLIACILIFIVCFESEAVEVISHRAKICNLHENSVKAIQASWLIPVTTVELDVRISKDNVVYLYHDDKIQGSEVKKLKYSAIVELVGLEKSPTLISALKNAPRAGDFLLDLKAPWGNKYSFIVDAIRKAGVSETQIRFQSDNLLLLKNIQQVLPSSKFIYLSRLRSWLPFMGSPSAKNILAKVDNFKIDGVSLKGRKYLSKPFIAALKKTGLSVYVWTINDVQRAKHYRDIEVDGIITDNVLTFYKLFGYDVNEKISCSQIL